MAAFKSIAQSDPMWPDICLRHFYHDLQVSQTKSVHLKFSRKPHESRVPMSSIAILLEVKQLYNVSDRLDSLAEQHPVVSEALVTIAGSVRNTATLLEVLVATKIAPLSGSDPADAWMSSLSQSSPSGLGAEPVVKDDT
jgi:hypothetical protein